MPRPDGRLYPSEVDALRPKPEPRRRGRPPKPKPDPEPQKIIRMDAAENLEAACEAVRAKTGKPPLIIAKPGSRLRATPEIVEKVISLVRGGLSINKSLVVAGIHPSTVEKWRKINAGLDQQLAAAENELENELIGRQLAFARTDAKANAWLLERRFAWIPPQDRNSVATALAGGIVAMHKSLVDKVAEAKKADAINIKATAA